MRTMQDQLIEKGLSNGAKQSEKTETSKNQQTEKLSDREWKEIMGSNRDTFKRAKGGAIRRNR